MIRVQVRKKQDSYISFESIGHAGFAEEGQDIVCAAVSALIITTFNAMEKFTAEQFTAEDRDGQVKVVFREENTNEGRLLMDTLLLGLTEIREEYPEYLKVTIREV